jgi:hypothetical protein
MPIERQTPKPPVPVRVEPQPNADVSTIGRNIVESNERLALAIRTAVESSSHKVLHAKVLRDDKGRMADIVITIGS